MIVKYYSFFFFITFFFLTEKVCAQESEYSDLYIQFDRHIGIQNSDLYNGISYNEYHRVDRNQNKFLFKSGMQPGEVIYENQTYHNVLVNYNIYDDLLLVKLKSNSGTHTFQLIKEKVQGFKTDNFQFVHITPNSRNNNIQSGFYEILLSGTMGHIKLLKKSRLKENRNLTKNVTVYYYSEGKSEFFVQKQDKVFVVENIGDFHEIFPNYKSFITQFYKKNKTLKKSNPERFITNLIGFLFTKIQKI